LFARDPSARPVDLGGLYNGATLSLPAWEHGTRPSSGEATARPSAGREEDVFAKLPACRQPLYAVTDLGFRCRGAEHLLLLLDTRKTSFIAKKF
jgi:hypothetical protein